ncbi:MAG: VWA domain-containing protein [Candidatus Aenigmarchaeota archaeon]|nr:VWA domain-containing protein [Candidatus Aenigmarchaeota archaeon]
MAARFKLYFSILLVVFVLYNPYLINLVSAAGVDDWKQLPAQTSYSGNYNNQDSGTLLIIAVIFIFLVILSIILILKKHKLAGSVLLILPMIILAFLIFFGLFFSGMYNSFASMSQTSSMSKSLGYSVGGAKDINNFRKNVENNYLPLSTDITYEGLFYDYYFNTGAKQECTELFCPSYSYAISKDPISSNDDYYLSVGLNSNLKESDFKRKKLNLVVVLDVSGSMSSPFYQYYYDQFRTGNVNTSEADRSVSKMQIARESVVALLGHLNSNDRFGMVVFDQNAYVVKPVDLVGQTDMEKIKSHILELGPRGSTNMEEGLVAATSLLDQYKGSDQTDYENRIIFLTDAQPNTWVTGDKSLIGITKTNSENKIYTTFIGIGVDFNTELIENISKVKGANYYSVHSGTEFRKRMDDEFEYMVTPMVFNLLLKLDASGFQIEKVYGSPEADEATGTLMKVNTLFPSPTEENGTRGGIVLIKLKKVSSQNSLKLSVTYEDRSGVTGGNDVTFAIPENNPDHFDNLGIRKGIILSSYADLAKNWIIDERRAYGPQNKTFVVTITNETGIIGPINVTLGPYERLSIPLHVNSAYKQLFSQFKPYFLNEMDAIGDQTLNKEIPILDKLANF